MSLSTTFQQFRQGLSARFASLRQRYFGDPRPAASDPSAAMFRRIRLRLILWYASVLAVALLIAGGLLYFSMQQTVMGPVNQYLTDTAHADAAGWLRRPDAPPPCNPVRPHPDTTVAQFVACYDSTGSTLIGYQGLAGQAPGFLSPNLARQALQGGSASDIVDGGAGDGGYDLGAISRYALVVRDPDSHQILGVIQIGAQVEGQLDAMHALLTLLLILLPLALLCATIGGFFLAERALAPARLAFTRQQTFIADASHELRTPLTLLRADAEVLLRGRDRLNADDAALLEDIVTETEHLSSIANNLLTQARLDSGAMRMERDVLDLAVISREAAQRVDALARERGITVRLGDLVSVAVVGDAQLLAQATLALLDNALKYSGEGSEITLATAHVHDHGAEYGTLTVHDNGPGIAAEHLPLLGQRFYRPDKARARAAGGAGLGISVVRGILALHHGALTLESALGEGTSAIIRLPAIVAHERADAMPAPDAAEQHA